MKRKTMQNIATIGIPVLGVIFVVVLAFSISALLDASVANKNGGGAGGSTIAGTRVISDGGTTGFRATGTVGEGDVEIELTLVKTTPEFIFEISANTHSVGLDQFDLMQLSTITVGRRTLAPLEASRLSGHHASGTLRFPAISATEKGKSGNILTLTIQGIPQIEERVYQWNLDDGL